MSRVLFYLVLSIRWLAVHTGWEWPGSDNNLYSHSNVTLFLPDGNYNLTPGATAEVKCNVYGPGATLQAHTAASGALLSIGTAAFRNIKLNGLHGYYLPYTEGQATTPNNRYQETGQNQAGFMRIL